MLQQLPNLSLNDWKSTRDTLHQYARIIGKVRSRYMPKSKHWWHITLSVSARGLTTTPLPVGGQNLELILNLVTHRLTIDSSEGWSAGLSLEEQSPAGLCRHIAATLTAAGVEVEEELFAAFDGETVLPYDTKAIGRYRRAVNWVDAAFKAFKGGLREETSPVQIFPHHLDLAMNWFSGRLVPGIDPADEESADEQMNFGFVTGDDSIPDAYFYVTAYPAPAGWTELELPGGAYWHTEGWTGAILPYTALVASSRPQALLADYLQTTQAHGKRLMA
ncbi:MAG: hypothetical protein KZQ97_16725 [Candidatus Thiodiazotropha sp. (ex Dulcina madagascariensis)]|nr:hypothetical protein [Candidatus Thiodiazotropha sp. (ex Dulcina madagascariensis)]